MKFTVRLAFMLAVGGLSLTGMAHSADYWVGRRGNDRQQGGSRTRPWASLQFTADHVKAGDSVHVLDGDYVGFDLRTGGNRESPIRFIAEGRNVKITRPNGRTPDGINVEGAGYVVIEGFIVNEMPRAGVRGAGSPHLTIRRVRADRNGVWGIFTGFCDDLAVIDNLASNSVKEHGIYVSNSADRPIIRGNVSWGNRQCGIHMNGDVSQGGDGNISEALVENNIIFGNGRGGGSGINCDGVQESIFRNNLLYDNHASGISLYRINSAAGSKNNRIINNTILMAGNGRWAINIGSRSTGNVVWNNILLNNNPSRGCINIEAESLVGFHSDFNIVVDRFSPDGDHTVSLKQWQSKTGLDCHSRVATPQELFLKIAVGDYHLRADAPAIDAADPSLATQNDLEGRPRPFGARPDIGAFEWRGTPAPGGD